MSSTASAGPFTVKTAAWTEAERKNSEERYPYNTAPTDAFPGLLRHMECALSLQVACHSRPPDEKPDDETPTARTQPAAIRARTTGRLLVTCHWDQACSGNPHRHVKLDGLD